MGAAPVQITGTASVAAAGNGVGGFNFTWLPTDLKQLTLTTATS